eukprot:gene11614-4856_t
MTISENEAKLYDRQIRLWGIDAQQRMSKTRILVHGMKGISAEVCKNLVLSGVGNVTIMDDEVTEYSDLGSQFLINENNVGKNRAEVCLENLQKLNPLVKLSINTDSLYSKDEKFFSNFDIVLLTNTTLNEQIRVNNICRKNNILFLSADSFGLYSIFFQDLLDFDYKIKDPSDQESKELLEKKIKFQSLQEIHEKVVWNQISRLTPLWVGIQLLYAFKEKFNHFPKLNELDEFLKYKEEFLKTKFFSGDFISKELCETLCRNANTEINYVCAINGGLIANEIIKIISKNADPVDNYLVYDGVNTYSGFIEKIKN